jgi:hypothetical protein
MSENVSLENALARVTEQIGTILKTLIDDHGFSLPIRAIIKGANSSWIIADYHERPDDSGCLGVEFQYEEIPGRGLMLPIDMQFHDSGSRRVAHLASERGELPGPVTIRTGARHDEQRQNSGEFPRRHSADQPQAEAARRKT